MRATVMFLGVALAFSTSGCSEEQQNDVVPYSPDKNCPSSCETDFGFSCVDGKCEPSGTWSLYVKSASIAGSHKWDDTPVVTEWPPDPVVCATAPDGFKEGCSSVRANTTTPAWTSSGSTFGHILGVTEPHRFERGIEVTIKDDDLGTLEAMCTMTFTPTSDDFSNYRFGLRAICETGLAKGSSVELLLRPGGY